MPQKSYDVCYIKRPMKQASDNSPPVLVRVENLVKHFPKRGGMLNQVIAKVHAVNGVSFVIRKGETLGVVGESGCGKSTLGKALVRLHDLTSGQIVYDGQDITDMSGRELRSIRKKMQMIFQDPNSSLNPRMTVGAAIREVAKFHGTVNGREETKRFIRDRLEKVGLQADSDQKYPHEFSGGQKQRVGIARALAVNPEFIVADEPVSALDVSIQAQVLNLLMDLKEEFDLTLLFISHDLKVIDHFCDRMLVMYLGNIVEEMPCEDIHTGAMHPYTQALLSANPVTDPDQRHELTVLEGEVPSPYDPPAGCPFVTRCPIKVDRCDTENPPLVQIGKNHRVACWEVEAPAETNLPGG
jgi:oligopeptide transport system ATP-binding protein